jgi:ribosome-binding protein aMBF1 (putative translation factor)
MASVSETRAEVGRMASAVEEIVERVGPTVRRERAEQGLAEHDPEQLRRLAALLAQAERMGWGRE